MGKGGRTESIGCARENCQKLARYQSPMNTKGIELLCYWCVTEEKKMLELRNIQAQYSVVSGNEANLSLLAADHHPATSTCTADGSYELSTCCECGQLEDPSSDVPILLCDGCDNHCHLLCVRVRPKLTEVPQGDWYCSACVKKRTRNEIPQKVVTGSKIAPIMSPSSQDESSSAIGATENRPMDADATTTAPEDGDDGGTSNDLGAGVMYVRFVGGHPSNPILRVQLPREEENAGSAAQFDLPYSGPNDAVEMSPTYLQQANVVDIKPLPPRQISDGLADASTTNDADAERAQRHKARKGVAAKIYRLLEHQPESWPQQWRLRFSELTNAQRVSFVSKLEHKLYMGSATIEGHLKTATLRGRVYDFLKKFDRQKREQTGATAGITIECSFEDNNATTLHNGISPQSVMEAHTPQHQQEPHRQYIITAPHGHPVPVPPTEHAYRQFAEKKAAAEEEIWWNSCFEKLVDYQQRCGAKALPDLNYTIDGPLTTWIRAQQTQHVLKLQGMKNNMTDERELKLNSVGFNLRWSSRELASQACVEEDAYYSQWVKMYKHFGDYQEYKQSGAPLEIQRWPGLQKWLTHQKREHQKKLGGSPTTLTDAMEYSIFRLGIINYNCLTRAVQAKVSDGSIHEEKIRLLVDYGKFSTSELWHLMFDEIVAYKEKHGHFIMESSINKTLYLWMNRQRASYSQSKLSSERTQLLDSVGFPWQKKRKLDGRDESLPTRPSIRTGELIGDNLRGFLNK